MKPKLEILLTPEQALAQIPLKIEDDKRPELHHGLLYGDTLVAKASLEKDKIEVFLCRVNRFEHKPFGYVINSKYSHDAARDGSDNNDLDEVYATAIARAEEKLEELVAG